jgi:hypothetical protein
MGLVQKTFILMLCMNLFLYFYLPSDLNLGQDTLLSKFLDISEENVEISSELQDTLPTSSESTTSSIGGGILSFIDNFGLAWDFIRFILTMLFAPILVAFIVPNIPVTVALLFILPNILILGFGIISFIKGYDF